MFCPFCGSQNSPDASQCFNCNYAFAKPEAAPSCSQPDWEEHGHLLNFVSFFITVRDVLFSPAATFRHLKRDRALFNAFLFGLIGSTIGGVAGTFWQYLVSLLGIMPQTSPLFQWFGTTSNFILALFVVPFASAVALFLISLFLHVMLKILGGAKHGFAATFKVYAYSHGATALLGLIPFFGSITGFFWMIIICAIGLKEAHSTSGLRAVAAILLPMLFFFAFIAVAVFLLILSGLGLAYFSNLL